MADRVVLHVGAMKSGTTYLQNLLFAEKARLRERDVHVVRDTWSDQARAVRQRLAPARQGRPMPAWDSLVEEVRAASGTAVVSVEYLGPAGVELARQVVDDLGAPRTSVVLTVRDLARTLVSLWQETVQNGRSWTWAEYVADVEARRPGALTEKGGRHSAGGTFWRQQDVVRLYDEWSSVVGGGGVTLVAVPRVGADRGELAGRFSQASEVPLDPARAVPVSNESLGLASTMVLRRLNELLDELGHPFPAGNRQRKHVLAKAVLAGRRADEPSLGFDPPSWVAEQAQQTREQLLARSARFVGAWDDLAPSVIPGVAPGDLDPSALAEAALAGLAGLLSHQIERREGP
jgi:hypothetical protein